MISRIAHELSEGITDPVLYSNNAFVFNGWYAGTITSEIADICNTQYGEKINSNGGNILVGNLYFYIQSLWSNSAGKCTMN